MRSPTEVSNCRIGIQLNSSIVIGKGVIHLTFFIICNYAIYICSYEIRINTYSLIIILQGTIKISLIIIGISAIYVKQFLSIPYFWLLYSVAPSQQSQLYPILRLWLHRLAQYCLHRVLLLGFHLVAQCALSLTRLMIFFQLTLCKFWIRHLGLRCQKSWWLWSKFQLLWL